MLSINISEMVLTVLNFLVLLFLLNKLLYKPLVSFMDQRQSRMDALVAKRQAAEEELEREERQCENGTEAARIEAQQLIDQATAQREQCHAQLMDNFYQREQEQRRTLETEMAQLETKEAAELTKVEGELAQLLAERLLHGDA